MENFKELEKGKKWAWEFEGEHYQAILASKENLTHQGTGFLKYTFQFWKQGKDQWTTSIYGSLSEVVLDESFFERATKHLFNWNRRNGEVKGNPLLFKETVKKLKEFEEYCKSNPGQQIF